MPTYEYQCSRCDNRFEEFQSITADPLSKCPKCGGPIKRLIGAGVGIIFKGSGFYTTDYKKSSATSSTPKKTESTTSSEKKDTGSSSSESKSGSSSSKKD
jgi:putative FmdB family regulatory protein